MTPYSCLMLSHLTYGAAESWALMSSLLETFHTPCMRRMMGWCQGLGGPSTAELLGVTGQVPITQLLSRHSDRWLGHAGIRYKVHGLQGTRWDHGG